LVDGPTAADESVAGGGVPADAMAVLCRVCWAADVPVGAIALVSPASSVQVWVAGRIAADVSRAADERCYLPLAEMVA
jgi:hypothetical protein